MFQGSRVPGFKDSSDMKSGDRISMRKNYSDEEA